MLLQQSDSNDERQYMHGKLSLEYQIYESFDLINQLHY